MQRETFGSLVLSIAAHIQDQLIPRLLIPADLGALSPVAADKAPDHQAFEIDLYANELFLSALREHGFNGRAYSEEGGWTEHGSGGDRVLVCDPYDNTSLTFRGFRESSVVITEGTVGGEFHATAIADLQMFRVLHCAAGSEAEVWTTDRDGRWERAALRTSRTLDLGAAHVAVSLMKRKRRVPANPDLNLLWGVGTLHATDGAIMIARVAAGELDAYVDAFVGQPAYELPAVELIRRAGGVVTDETGTDLTFDRVMGVMRDDPSARIRVVAAANPDLHAEIMRCREGRG